MKHQRKYILSHSSDKCVARYAIMESRSKNRVVQQKSVLGWIKKRKNTEGQFWKATNGATKNTIPLVKMKTEAPISGSVSRKETNPQEQELFILKKQMISLKDELDLKNNLIMQMQEEMACFMEDVSSVIPRDVVIVPQFD